MPPRISRLPVGLAVISKSSSVPRCHQICAFCSASPTQIRRRYRRPRLPSSPASYQSRYTSDIANGALESQTHSSSPEEARIELRNALLDVQKHAGSYVNISRLQLALRGLEQPMGEETIRVAILAIPDGGKSLRKAKELLRLVAADPLNGEEEWERTLVDEGEDGRPVLLKIGPDGTDEQGSRLVQQLNIKSPMLNGHRLELLVLEMDPPSISSGATEADLKDAVLVPTMEIPTSSTGRYTPVTTPVHKALIVGDGILGASRILSLPVIMDASDPDITWATMDLEVKSQDASSSLPFKSIDISLGNAALNLFRQSVGNALKYEQDWFSSRMPEIIEWIKLGSAPVDGATKDSLRRLITSLLDNTLLQIENEKSQRLSTVLAEKITSDDLNALKAALASWAERAHTELRDELDIAFAGRRWRKLGWWKLFWRVDDVSMIASDILGRRFLTDAEKEVIFVSGRLFESGIQDKSLGQAGDPNWAFKHEAKKFEEKLGVAAPDAQLKNILDRPEDTAVIAISPRPWPLQIPIARSFLLAETVPALQALAQKLVLQTLSTSALASAFSGLIYVSTLSTSLYEAGAVAAFGIVWSLRRMQTKWEAARKFWEGEVREEGRKAVRSSESELGLILKPTNRPIEGAAELEKAVDVVYKAQTAFQSSK
ncbi:hypothetical protein BP6252_02133 [Coleophoma cylindrospora]|uniref:Mmc1 C-terminal domain-containing protein n=1 Tax=Coleophoma cylindrospora TaxID=1849047 RepID=A0A3D8SE00_9HELO|nr:hypothetical protein BP6252_02133 [Coleophoma cylindrospora]